MNIYSKEMVDAANLFSNAKRYKKKVTTQAIRIDGEFLVETSEGPLTCRDGYLCKDARGYPYPVAREEFELIYEPAGEE